VVRWLAERGQEEKGANPDDETGPGALYASGLIAAGGIVGLLGIVIKLVENQGWMKPGAIAFGEHLGFVHESQLLGLAMFVLLGYSLFHFARKPLEPTEPASVVPPDAPTARTEA